MKGFFKDLKTTWKPVLVLWLISVIISYFTGYDVGNIEVTAMGVIVFFISIWSLWTFIKTKGEE